jgi:uncharacterized protein
MKLDKSVLDILACPKCKGSVSLSPSGQGLICENCKLMYPIKEQIPIMLIDEALKIQ